MLNLPILGGFQQNIIVMTPTPMLLEPWSKA
jgi:hypothetical protein